VRTLGEGTFGKVVEVYDCCSAASSSALIDRQSSTNSNDSPLTSQADDGDGVHKSASRRSVRTERRLALKIIKNVHKYREAAKLEINVLNCMNKRDPDCHL
jgi:hypothetical protein